jgi:hypothetical protein
MSTTPTAAEPNCVACGDVWQAKDERRWRAYVDGEHSLVFFCPSCAEREFEEPTLGS